MDAQAQLGLEFFYAAVNSVTVAIWLADEVGSLCFTNRAWSALTGLTLEQAQRDNRQSTFAPED